MLEWVNDGVQRIQLALNVYAVVTSKTMLWVI